MRRRKLLVSAQTQKTSFLDKLDDDRQTFAVYVSLFIIYVLLFSRRVVCKKYEKITLSFKSNALSYCLRFVSAF